MRVQSFTFEPDGVAEFVDVGRDLREGDPTWIPPIRDTLRTQLSEANPFFRHGRIRNFLVVRGGDPVGRCSAILDERLTRNGRPLGMLGLFEVERSYDTARTLLDAALGWMKEEGVPAVWGPLDFSIFNGYRFKTRGFDRSPFLGEPGNPPEYPAYFERYGFQLLEAFTAWDLTREHVRVLHRNEEEAARRKGVWESGYRYRPFDTDRFHEELEGLHGLAVECFRGHTGFVPLSYEEFAFWNRGARALMDPTITVMIEAPDGELVGASYNYPDMAPLLRELDGELPAGVAGSGPADVERAVLHTDMVRPGHRRRGLIHGALARFLEAALSGGYVRMVTGLAKLENAIWAETLKMADREREYAIYRLKL